MEIQHYFEWRQVEMTDASVLWEVVNPMGDRVASCTNEDAAQELAMNLDMTLTDWVEADESGESDRVANCL